MRRLRPWMALAGAVALIPVLAAASVGPTQVRDGNVGSGPQTQSIAYEVPVPVYPVGPYGPGGYAATPEIISRIGEILAAIDSPQKRTELAEQWLRYSREVIAKDLEYRRQWLDLQREQLSQLREVEQLRLEVARLQAQVEELRARNAQLERQNLQTSSTLRPRPGG